MLNLQIQTTSKCNGKCVICPYHTSWQKNNPGEMSIGMLLDIKTQLRNEEFYKISFYLENEPFMDQNLAHKLSLFTKKLKYKYVEVSTNASTYRQDVVDVLGRIPHILWVSFHGVDEKTYKNNMGLDFHKALKNIRKFKEEGLNILIRGAGGPRNGMTTRYKTFTKRMFKEFWKGYDTQYFTFHDRAGNCDFKFGTNRMPRRCTRTTNWLHILWDGSVVLCCMDYFKETVIGNYTSLKEAMSNRKFMDLCRRCPSPGG